MLRTTTVDALVTEKKVILRWPDGTIEEMDPATFEARFPGTKPVAGVVQPKSQAAPIVAKVDDDDDQFTTGKICIECGATVDKVYPSGRCAGCAQVKCPTCHKPARASDMMGGQYCPNCIPR